MFPKAHTSLRMIDLATIFTFATAIMNRLSCYLASLPAPANLFREHGDGWAERTFNWIRTSISTKSYNGQAKWWAPNYNSTFTRIPDTDLAEFESAILVPYFDLHLAEFRINVDD
jgi:hypothetical protein